MKTTRRNRIPMQLADSLKHETVVLHFIALQNASIKNLLTTNALDIFFDRINRFCRLAAFKTFDV
jgi:hypothetical protein